MSSLGLLRFTLTTRKWNKWNNRRGFHSSPVALNAIERVQKGDMLPPGTFKGQIALVTGGGTGLGKGIASKLSNLGAHVVICSRKFEVVQKTAEELTKATNNKVLPLQTDVRDAASVTAAIDSIVKEFGGVPTLVVNNAAGNFVAPFERLTPNGFKTIIDIVLNGTANVTLEVGKRLIKEKKGGSFLSISTTYADTGSAFVVPSASAKAGVDAFTKSLSAEWNRYGIRLNGIAPGPIETKGAFSRLLPHVYTKKENQTPEETAAMESKIRGEWMADVRIGHPEELANLATYILSDYASWMTGTIVLFDGGSTRLDGGMFNRLLKLKQHDWDAVEAQIRKTKGS